MGVYYWIVNHDKRETLRSPQASKEFEWNHPANPSASVVLWALFWRWSGDRIEVVTDECEAPGCGYLDVWREVEADYHRALKGRGVSLERGFDGCKHGFPWANVGRCEDCFPKVER